MSIESNSDEVRGKVDVVRAKAVKGSDIKALWHEVNKGKTTMPKFLENLSDEDPVISVGVFSGSIHEGLVKAIDTNNKKAHLKMTKLGQFDISNDGNFGSSMSVHVYEASPEAARSLGIGLNLSPNNRQKLMGAVEKLISNGHAK